MTIETPITVPALTALLTELAAADQARAALGNSFDDTGIFAEVNRLIGVSSETWQAYMADIDARGARGAEIDEQAPLYRAQLDASEALRVARAEAHTRYDREHAAWWDAHAAASARQQAARNALAQALAAAPWGRQEGTSGRVFVSRRSSWPQGINTHITVYVDGLERVHVRQDANDGELDQLRIFDLATVRANRQQQRALARDAHAGYLAALDRAAEGLRLGTLHLAASAIVDGQRGGYVELDGRRLSIPGLLRRAGIPVLDGSHPHATLLAELAADQTPEYRALARDRQPRVRSGGRSLAL